MVIDSPGTFPAGGDAVQAQRADRGSRAGGQVLDDGLLANWLLLARQVIAVAAADYIAVTFPDCAESYIATWLDRMPSRERRQAWVEAERQWLTDFWNDGGAEFAEWVGCADYTRRLAGLTAAHVPGETPPAREHIQDAFREYAGRPQNGRKNGNTWRRSQKLHRERSRPEPAGADAG